jgi:membrane protein DedA with SNARE-associated domain
VEQHVADILAWLTPQAMLLAVLLPPLSRMVGHVVPEELVLVTLGVVAARCGSAREAALILGLAMASHFVTDQAVYGAGRWLGPRLRRFPRIAARLEFVTSRLDASPASLLGFIPARVFPLGRGAWLAGFGVVRLPWSRFAAIDFIALSCHLLLWSGLGWWFAGDLGRLDQSAQISRRVVGVWVVGGAIAAGAAVLLWRRRPSWQPATGRVLRRAGRSLRQWSWLD